MVTCGRQTFNMLPMAPMNPFVVGLATPTAMAAAAAASRSEPVAPVAAAAAAPTSTATATTTTPPTKPKLAFSIDSIVGNEREKRRGGGGGESPGRTPQRPPSPLNMQRRSESPAADRCESRLSVGDEAPLPLELRNTSAHLPHPPRGFLYCRRPSSLERAADRDRSSPGRDRCRSRSPPPQIHIDLSRSPTPNGPRPPTPGKGPIMVPGIPAALLRPAPNLQPLPLPQNLNTRCPMEDSPTIPLPRSSGDAPPPPLPAAAMPPGPPQLPPQPPTNPHFLAAQFQMAAALAHHHHQQQQQQQQQHQQQHHQPHHLPPHHHVPHPHVPGHLPPGHPMAIFPPGPHAHFAAPHLIRDSYPLYPWLLSRHGRIFPHRFPGNFLLQPFRKPKRVRTAFSPTQLLKLEHAFEGNHYVVGAERKQLAQGLSLTETQVKVWFQNRRTKHKRMQQEGDSDSKSNKGSTAGDHDGKNDSSRNSFEDGDDEEDDDELAEDEEDDEDELIDMDDDYVPATGDEMDEHQMREQFQQQLQQHHMQQHQQHQLQQQQQQHNNQQHLMLQHQLYLQQQQQQQHSHAKPTPPQN